MQDSQLLTLGMIRIDGGTQSRAALDPHVLDEYTELVSNGGEFSSWIVVFYDGTDYWLADGFHRAEAYRRAERLAINCSVMQGSRRDAILYSCGANSRHGLRRKPADKRRAVETLLRDSIWGDRAGYSDRWVAEKCGVSNTFVSRMRDELFPASSVLGHGDGTVNVDSSFPATEPDKRTGLDGKARSMPGEATAPGAVRRRVQSQPGPIHEPSPESPPVTQPTPPDESEPVDDEGGGPVAGVRSRIDEVWVTMTDFEQAQFLASVGVVKLDTLNDIVAVRFGDESYRSSRESAKAASDALGITRSARLITFALGMGEVAMAKLGLNYHSTYDDAKRAYRMASLSAHPDRGGTHDAMSRLNDEYAMIREVLEM